jgi:hypothetical protein
MGNMFRPPSLLRKDDHVERAAHNGATLVRIRRQQLSKRAQKFRRLLGLRPHNINQINNQKN